MSIMSFQICILPELWSPKVASKQGSRSGDIQDLPGLVPV